MVMEILIFILAFVCGVLSAFLIFFSCSDTENADWYYRGWNDGFDEGFNKRSDK